ncbi:MAG: hypothetical protein GEU90_07870 [Gemmatimonas sp.]|nr:hypothetical protein [Gemmatimonas sp.]
MKTVGYDEGDGSFDLKLPDDWDLNLDEEGGVVVAKLDGCGLLHIMPFSRDPGEDDDPADELYAFLEDQEVELQEDEVEDVELSGAGAGALCEYLAEDGEGPIHWLVFVATAPGQLLFASYSCSTDQEGGEVEAKEAREILTSLRFGDRLG